MHAATPDELNRLPRLREIVGRINITIDEPALSRLIAYRDLLLEANQHFNLTAITDPDDFEVRVLADSLMLLAHIPAHSQTLLDVGTGGGIPGIVLAIARPEMRVTLLDATGKKVRFLAETADALGLEHVTAIQGRAEELGRDARYREAFNVVTARAVARLATLAELTMPFVRRGGVTILPKGNAARDELNEARYAIKILGGREQPVHPAPVEGTNVVVIDKRSTTPDDYPRRTGIPSKLPLLRNESNRSP